MYQQNALSGKYSAPTFQGLAAAGLADLLPIIPPGAQLSPQSTVKPADCGKVPGDLGPNGWRSIPGWRGQAVASSAHLQAWDLNELARGAGIGLRAAEFPGVDIDVSDAALADQLTRLTLLHLGPSPRRIGRAPRRLHPYRLKPGSVVGKRVLEFTLAGVTHKVEVLGSGQQYVLHGTHPGTGQPYAWPDGDLVTLGAGALPEVGEAELDAYMAAAAALVLQIGGALTSTAAHGATPDNCPDQDTLRAPGEGLARCTLVREALRSIPNGRGSGRSYDEWFRILCAVRASLGPDLADHPGVVGDVVAWSNQWDFDPQGHEDKYRHAAPPPHKVGWDHLRATAAAAGWNPRYETELRLADAVARFRAEPLPGAANDNPADEWFTFAELAGVAPPARRWVIPGWLPLGETTAMFGAGGTGKSLLAMQIATCVATGRPFAGLEIPEPGPVVAVYCEDDRDELHRRQTDICRVLGVGLADLGTVHVVSRTGQDNDLVRMTREGVASATDLYRRVSDKVRATRARLLIVDNIANVFGGEENARRQVHKFVTMLTALGQDHDCAVLLLGHPSKAQDSEYSGSTGWDGAVRSRWFFARPELDEDEALTAAAADLRVLRRSKSNYAKVGEEIALRYFHGAFLVDGATAQAPATAALHKRRHDEVFLTSMAELEARGEYCTNSPNSPGRYAPKILSTMPAAKAAKVTKRDLEAAMHRLFAGGYVRSGEVMGADRHKRRGLVAGDPLPELVEAPEDCGELAATSAATSAATMRDDCCGECGNPLNLHAAGCGASHSYIYDIGRTAPDGGPCPSSGRSEGANPAAEFQELERRLATMSLDGVAEHLAGRR